MRQLKGLLIQALGEVLKIALKSLLVLSNIFYL